MAWPMRCAGWLEVMGPDPAEADEEEPAPSGCCGFLGGSGVSKQVRAALVLAKGLPGEELVLTPVACTSMVPAPCSRFRRLRARS